MTIPAGISPYIDNRHIDTDMPSSAFFAPMDAVNRMIQRADLVSLEYGEA